MISLITNRFYLHWTHAYSISNNLFSSFSSISHSLNILKMDEITTANRIRWNPEDNKLYGICYQHIGKHTLAIASTEDIERISNPLQSGDIHKTKEDLVVGIGSMVADASVKHLALPTANKSEISSFDDMINEVVKSGICLDIFATDGDPMRRISLSKLPLFDLQFICLSKKAFGLYLDDKHLSKRFRCVVISLTRGCKISNTVIANEHLQYLFKSFEIKNYSTILNPNDRQNVPAVLNFCAAMSGCLSKYLASTLTVKEDKILIEIIPAINALNTILDGICCIFAKPDRFERLTHEIIDACPHLLLSISREWNILFTRSVAS